MRPQKLVAIKLLVLSLFNLMSAAAKQHVEWTRTEVMDPFGLYILQWRLERKDIIFTATVNTRGFIGLGFSYRHGRMTGSDLVLAWVDDHTGLPNILVSIAPPPWTRILHRIQLNPSKLYSSLCVVCFITTKPTGHGRLLHLHQHFIIFPCGLCNFYGHQTMQFMYFFRSLPLAFA